MKRHTIETQTRYVLQAIQEIEVYAIPQQLPGGVISVA